MSKTTAAEIRVLSAGAVQPGMAKVIETFRRETGYDVQVTFATAPAISKRIVGGDKVDVVVVPPAVLDELARSGKTVPAQRVTVGRIGVGVMVRDGARLPKIATVEEFKDSLLSAESVVYNQASTGIYIEGLFEKLGIGEQLKVKTTRYPDAAAVLNHISTRKGNEIGLAATTVIVEGQSKGLRLVGPLPQEFQNYTIYAAAVVTNDVPHPAATEFLRYLSGPDAKRAFATAGINPADPT
jgi:molybdate transport system substrate-binding protein